MSESRTQEPGLPAATAPSDMLRLRVAAGRTVYLGGRAHPFRGGDVFPLRRAEAADLLRLGHVTIEA